GDSAGTLLQAKTPEAVSPWTSVSFPATRLVCDPRSTATLEVVDALSGDRVSCTLELVRLDPPVGLATTVSIDAAGAPLRLLAGSYAVEVLGAGAPANLVRARTFRGHLLALPAGETTRLELESADLVTVVDEAGGSPLVGAEAVLQYLDPTGWQNLGAPLVSSARGEISLTSLYRAAAPIDAAHRRIVVRALGFESRELRVEDVPPAIALTRSEHAIRVRFLRDGRPYEGDLTIHCWDGVAVGRLLFRGWVGPDDTELRLG